MRVRVKAVLVTALGESSNSVLREPAFAKHEIVSHAEVDTLCDRVESEHAAFIIIGVPPRGWSQEALCRHVRASASTRWTPVVVISDECADTEPLLLACADDVISTRERGASLDARVRLIEKLARSARARRFVEQRAAAYEERIDRVCDATSVLVASFTHDLRCVDAHGSMLEPLGLMGEPLVGRSAQEIFGEAAPIHMLLNSALRGETVATTTMWHGINSRVTCSPRRALAGDQAGVTLVAVTAESEPIHSREPNATSDRLVAERNAYRDILDTLDGAVLVVDFQGRCTYMTRGASILLGHHQNDVHHTHWSQLIQCDGVDKRRLQHALRDTNHHNVRFPLVVRRSASLTMHVEAEVQHAPSALGAYAIYLYDVHDLTVLKQRLRTSTVAEELVAHSAPMRDLLARVRVAAVSRPSILLYGPAGSGRRTVGRVLHRWGQDHTTPLYIVHGQSFDGRDVRAWLANAQSVFTDPAAPEFDIINPRTRATLFLADVDALDLKAQTELADIIRPWSLGGTDAPIWCMASVRVRPDLAIASSRLHPELVDAVGTRTLEVPPLAARRPDINLLAHLALAQSRASTSHAVYHFEADAMRALVGFHWPGEAAELYDVVAAATAISEGDSISLRDLPGCVTEHLSRLEAHADESERARLVRAIERAGGNRKRAAEALGISRATLYRRLDQHAIGTRS